MDEIDQVEKLRKRSNLQKSKEEQQDFKWLMESKQGRRVARWILDKAGIHRTTFRTNSEMPFLEGQRNLGLMLMSAISQHNPTGFILMLQEQLDDDRISSTSNDRNNDK